MERHTNWYKLDNAAKIIPSTVSGANTRVFRISCELFEEIDPVILQRALDESIVEYPFFNCILRRGLFWYYLEDSNLSCEVEEEHLPPCSALYLPGKKSLLYRVFYYKRRISIEMFHVLADGTGAFMFFRRMVTRYLEIAHDFHADDDFFAAEISSLQEKNNDAFRHFYQNQKGLKQLKSLSSNNAYQLHGEADSNNESHIVEACVSAKAFKKLAEKYGSTVGVLSTAVYIAAIIDTMSTAQKKKPIVVSVPVNLRQYFQSYTARNFFGVISIKYDPMDFDNTLQSIIDVVNAAFKKQLEPSRINETMNSYAALEHNIAIKVVPLFIKDYVVGQFDAAAKKGVTTSISNMGVIKMPAEVTPFIERFAAFMTASKEQITICSFRDKMVFGECSAFTNHPTMLNLCRRLTAEGIGVEISTNDYDVPIIKEKKTRESK
ncbi:MULTISPECIES: hypothetical protein [unclassified Butyrivibrio]|uniref:hypothetical protein n=1 Tax=unclassified Butyrivibrio TaxID=2639466 RepID=UPI0003B622C7|nr:MULTISPECIES: hypothetical protein [unclassified Butyrivibrio]